jgi:hypothetical protein
MKKVNGGGLSQTVIFAWFTYFLGTSLWIYGYFVAGHPPLVDWHAYTPWWIADFLPNVESEIGMIIVCIGAVLMYWPLRR